MQLDAIALHVPDLEAAETYYAELFATRLVGREAQVPGSPIAGSTFDP